MYRPILCMTAFAFCFLSGSTTPCTCWAQSDEGNPELSGSHAFDQFQIAAASLGVEANQISKAWTPEPSVGLTQLIKSRPRMILVLKGGALWQMKSIANDNLKPVDSAVFNLNAQDLNVLLKTLDHPFLKQWTKCMREAWESKAGAECLTTLADSIEKEPPPLHDLLYANIGGKLVSISVRNPAWQKLAMSSGATPSIQRCLSAYKDLEGEKLMLAVGKSPAGRMPKVAYTQLTSDQSWLDFATWTRSDDKSVQQQRVPGTQVTFWNVDGQEPQSLPFSKEHFSARAVTMSLTPEQYVILTGDIGKITSDRLKELQSMADIREFAKKQNLQVHLSRTGERSVGGP